MKDFDVVRFMVKFEGVIDDNFRTDDSFLLLYVMRLQETAMEAA
jgi:hypothetical protein